MPECSEGVGVGGEVDFENTNILIYFKWFHFFTYQKCVSQFMLCLEKSVVKTPRVHLFVHFGILIRSVPIGRIEIKTPTGRENMNTDGRIHWTMMCLLKKKNLLHGQWWKITFWKKKPPIALKTAKACLLLKGARIICQSRRVMPHVKLLLPQRAWQKSRARLFCLRATQWMLKLGQLRFQLLSLEVTRKPIPPG